MLRTYTVINALDAILYQRPKTVDGVCVAIAHYVDVVLVKDFLVTVSHLVKRVVNSVLIGINLRALLDFVLDDREKRSAFGVWNGVGFDLPVVSTGYPNNRRFVRRSASALPASRSAEVRLVNLDLARHWVNIFGQHRANFLAHSPGRLVGNAGFPFNLFSGNPAPGLCYEVDHIKPSGQRSAGLVEYGSGSGRNLMTAVFTSVNLASLDAVIIGFPPAPFANNRFGIALMSKPIQANVIVREICLKVFDRVLFHLDTYVRSWVNFLSKLYQMFYVLSRYSCQYIYKPRI